jgi:diguanylate cyclase (GGDEF)-like protein
VASVHAYERGSESASASADAVRAARLQLLYSQSFPAVLTSLAAASLLAAILWPAADRDIVVAWLAILAATSVARMSLFLVYRRQAPSGARLLDWERPYLLTLMVSALTWGLGCLWIMPKQSLLHQAITLVILVGMAGGALSIYSAIRWLAIATIAALLLPATVWLFASGDRTALLLALGMILFCASALRATKVLSNTLQQNFEMTHALREAKDVAERLANVDALTGLTNRRAFLDWADAPFHYCRRNGLSVAAIVLDLDHFKQANDTRGHAVGDMALQHTASLIQATLRKSDLCCRWGGEEFVILLPDTSLEEALNVAEKLRSTIAASPVPVPSGDLAITASLGVADGQRDLESLIDRADAALYRAKREGRNRVARDEPGAAGLPPGNPSSA